MSDKLFLEIFYSNSAITTTTINTKAMRIDIDGIVSAYELNRPPHHTNDQTVSYSSRNHLVTQRRH